MREGENGEITRVSGADAMFGGVGVEVALGLVGDGEGVLVGVVLGHGVGFLWLGLWLGGLFGGNGEVVVV